MDYLITSFFENVDLSCIEFRGNLFKVLLKTRSNNVNTILIVCSSACLRYSYECSDLLIIVVLQFTGYNVSNNN